MSLLEWMMTKVPFYGRIPQDEEDELGDYNPLIITKLLKNYRSHPSILEVDLKYSIQTCTHESIAQYITTSFIDEMDCSYMYVGCPKDSMIPANFQTRSFTS